MMLDGCPPTDLCKHIVTRGRQHSQPDGPWSTLNQHASARINRYLGVSRIIYVMVGSPEPAKKQR